MKEPRDAYKVLQVDPEADLDVIQAAYRRLAQKYHPDRTTGSADADASQRMVELNSAWDQLRDPVRRSAYDRLRAAPGAMPRGRPDQGSPAPPPSAPEGAFWTGSTAAPRREGSTSAGPPPGRPSGSVLNFGRYSGWSLGEIGRIDPAYLEWLDRMPIGRNYRAELDAMLRQLGRRLSQQAEAEERRGLFRRR